MFNIYSHWIEKQGLQVGFYYSTVFFLQIFMFNFVGTNQTTFIKKGIATYRNI